MSADIITALQSLMKDIREHGCDAERLSGIQQICNVSGQLLRESMLTAKEEGHWAADGFVSPSLWAAAHTGQPRHETAAVLREAAALEHMAHSQAAARSGALCNTDVRLLTACQRSDPALYDAEVDAMLLGLVGTAELGVACRHWRNCAKAVNDPDPAELPEPPAEEPETLTIIGLLDGRGRIEGEFNPYNLAIINAAIGEQVARYLNNRRNGETSLADATINQLRAQALVDIADHALRDRPGTATRNGRHRVIVVLHTAADGNLQPETPIPPGSMCDSAFMRLVLGANGEVLDVGRDVRGWPDPIANAIRARDRHCTFPGCDRPPSWADIHHCHPWETGGETKITNGTLLCRWHHTLVHSKQWTVKLDEHQKPVFNKPDGTVHEHHPQRPRPPSRE